MKALKILSASAMIATLTPLTSCTRTAEQPASVRNAITLDSDTLTPEALWAMGRIGTYAVSPDGSQVAYQVTYYSVEHNNSCTYIYVQDIPSQTDASSGDGGSDAETASPRLLVKGSSPAWLPDGRVAYLSEGEVWTVSAQSRRSQQLTHTDGAVDDYLFAPDGSKVILIRQVPYTDIIAERPADLPQSTGRVINDLMYRHWDHYVESIPHPFLFDVESGEEFDILAGEPYECPMEPFGGVEQIAWSPDARTIAFTCRTKTGLAQSISTDSDIFLYDVGAHDLHSATHTRNLCKPGLEFGAVLPAADPFGGSLDPTKSLRRQPINTSAEFAAMNVGYDQNPSFSPDGRYIAWLSMERDGYESDRQRLCVCDLSTGRRRYVTESFDSSVDAFVWGNDSYTLYYIGVWHATTNLYRTDLDGRVVQLTDLQADWGSLSSPLPAFSKAEGGQPGSEQEGGVRLIMERHDYFHPADLYLVSIPDEGLHTGDDAVSESPVPCSRAVGVVQLTRENDHILAQLAPGSSEARWCTATDGRQLHYWVIKPPHFDSTRKYPTLLFCEGGPQSPVSQFWSYRWNFYIMASQGYVVIAPNRRGLPGFGQEWLEAVSGDWTGQCMRDYLSAIDDACAELPYVDRDRLAAVGASFGGFSVYYLAGHHDHRFKCFIAHDGAFNLEAMYTETEENWFSNWEYDDAYWNADRTAAASRTYTASPHLSVDQWDTPILCIHGERDYRINATQGMSAFNAARMRGIPAQLLLYPDENHWVLRPQNGILWQRTYFAWLRRWLGSK